MPENHESFRWNEPILAPSGVKRQHYVPEFFLESFTGPDDLLRVVDLEEGKEFRTNPTNAAVESYFNDLETGGEVLSTEGWLGQLEGEASPLLKSLTGNPDGITLLSVADELFIARFVAAQRFRTPQFRSYMGNMIESISTRTREMLRAQVTAQYPEEERSTVWEQIEEQHDQRWFGESGTTQPPDLSTSMLGEVKGWANLLWSAPWRIGFGPPELNLYTSDNPVAAYERPVREWWETAAFASLIYYVPLSPRILLKIERRPDDQDDSDPRGGRRRQDFTAEEISVARHVVTRDSARFLFGEGLIVPRDCASSCLDRMGKAKLRFAIHYLGFDPRPPSFP